MQFVDANVFLRLITGDHPEHSVRAHAFFKRLEAGYAKAVTSEAVLLEIVHVLYSPKSYGLGRPEVAARLRMVLQIPGLDIPNRNAYWNAADCFETSSVDFVDCLDVAHMQQRGITEIVSFDHDFDRFPGITRTEP